MDMSGLMRRDDAAATSLPDIGLSALDWRVVALARAEADRLGSTAFRTRGAIGRAWDRFVGREGAVRRLADERLEALRRFVGLARRGDREAPAAAALLATLGLQPPAIDLLRAIAVR